MSNCSRTNTGTTNHDGPHLLNWFHTDHRGRPIVESVNDVLVHAYEEDDDIAEAVAVVRGLVARARAEFRGNRKAYEAGFAVTTSEREAVELAVGDACDYMATNNYANDDSYPEDSALARFLGDTGGVGNCSSFTE
jgi:NOL1/NOP2/fmu family ribosome biogenesis protein